MKLYCRFLATGKTAVPIWLGCFTSGGSFVFYIKGGRQIHVCNMFYQVLQDVTDLINKIFCQPCGAWNFGAIQKWISGGQSRFNCPSKIS